MGCWIIHIGTDIKKREAMIAYLIKNIDCRTFLKISDMMEKDRVWDVSHHRTLGNYVRTLLLQGRFGVRPVDLNGMWAELIREAVNRKVIDASVLTICETI